MIFNLIKKIDSYSPLPVAKAHCDIPCKIYDPMPAQLAVLTMIRMVDLIAELPSDKPLTLEQHATLNRLVQEKEKHGQIVKNEIQVIWGDYIKQPQLDKYPDLHKLTHDIMLTASAAKQKVDRTVTADLLDLVNQFAEIFWQTKNIAVYRAKCPYLPEEIVVYPDLK